MIILLLPLLVVLAGKPVAPSAGLDSATQMRPGLIQRGCPPDDRNSGSRVRTLLTSPLIAEMRSRFDLGTASADDIQLLTNDRDLDTCRALWNALEESRTNLSPGDHVSFYRSGDTYFVPISRHRRPAKAGMIRLGGFSSLDVYDAAYALVGRFGA
jgi:hypothetical protein